MHPRMKRLYWQVTALLLAAHFAGWAGGLPLAMALTAWQALHFAYWRRNVRAFEVQVRVGYLALLAAGTVPGLWPVHVVQFIGVNALLVADYCLLARILALAPWNRTRPLCGALIRHVFLTPPGPGSILDRMSPG